MTVPSSASDTNTSSSVDCVDRPAVDPDPGPLGVGWGAAVAPPVLLSARGTLLNTAALELITRALVGYTGALVSARTLVAVAEAVVDEEDGALVTALRALTIAEGEEEPAPVALVGAVVTRALEDDEGGAVQLLDGVATPLDVDGELLMKEEVEARDEGG